MSDWAARLVLGGCIEAMEALEPESIDVVVTDPPYGLEFMGKDWDKFSDRDLVTRTGHDRASSGAGFGQTSDGSPLPSFGGKLTSYECRVCHVRDAFRKGCRCKTSDWRAINPNGTAGAVAFQRFSQQWAEAAYRVLKPGGHLLAFGGTRTYHRMAVAIEDAGFEIRDSLHWIYGSGFPKSHDVSKAIDKKAGVEREPDDYTGPNFKNEVYGAGMGGGRTLARSEAVTEEAQEWAGWGTALKPAHEPIIMARKPLSGTVAETVLAHGTGAINVRGCAAGTEGVTRQVVAKEGPTGRENTSYGASIGSAPGGNEDAGGRWPANLLLAHLPECEGTGASHTDVLCAPGCPVAELNEMSGAVGGGDPRTSKPDSDGGATYSLARSSRNSLTFYNDDGGAARFFYISKPRTRERVGGTMRNLHPTVKPIDLMRHLVRLVTPPGGIVLDPFLGSGSTGCAAMVEGFRFIGVEQDADSFETSLARISDYAFAHGRGKVTSETSPADAGNHEQEVQMGEDEQADAPADPDAPQAPAEPDAPADPDAPAEPDAAPNEAEAEAGDGPSDGAEGQDGGE